MSESVLLVRHFVVGIVVVVVSVLVVESGQFLVLVVVIDTLAVAVDEVVEFVERQAQKAYDVLDNLVRRLGVGEIVFV